METKFEITNECEGTFHAYADASEVEVMRGEILKKVSRNVNIPGFRPGKAPINLVRKRFQKDTDIMIRERLLKDALKSSESAKGDRIVIDYSGQEINELDEGGFEVLLHVTYIPTFELPPYKGIKVAKESENVTDEEVTSYLADIARAMATYSTEERPATAEDCIVIDFTTTVDGKSPSEACGCNSGSIDGCEDYELERDDDILSMLFDALVGAIAGEERVCEFDLDDSFVIPELRGKHIAINCKVKEVKSVHVPDLESEEFLRNNNVPNSAILRSAVRSVMEHDRENWNISYQNKQVFDFIVSHVDFPLPQKFIDMQTETVIRERYGSEQETGGKTEEEIRNEARQDAIKMLHFFYTAREIARKEGLSATDDELAREITQMAIREGISDANEYFRELERNGQIRHIRDAVVVKKVLTFMAEHADATIEEKIERQPAEESVPPVAYL